jgi:pimeloyl-ACP methyl ester carboxylesterase
VRGERLNDGLSVVTTGEGPPLVTLPGLGPGADLSVRVPRTAALTTAALAKGLGRTVHLIHRPLHPPPGMTIADLARWHATALRGRFGGPVDVIGTSAGGVTALQLVLDHPGVVRRLVLQVAASRLDGVARRDLLRVVQGDPAAARIGSRLLAHGPLRVVFRAAYALPRRRAQAPGEVAVVAAAQDWDVTGRLAEIEAPVLVVGGGRDPLVRPELARATADGIRGARLLLLPGRGHATALFDRRVKPAVADFLDS